MQTITLRARADQDGVVRLAIPTHQAQLEVEIVVIMQLLQAEALDAMGYPVGYFEAAYGSFAHEPLEREQPHSPDARDELE